MRFTRRTYRAAIDRSITKELGYYAAYDDQALVRQKRVTDAIVRSKRRERVA